MPEEDPGKYVFGFGRRVCPGRALVDAFFYLNVVQTLAVFNIGLPVENGKEVEIPMEFTINTVSRPKPFKVSINPRSDHHKKMILSIEDQYPWLESDADFFREKK